MTDKVKALCIELATRCEVEVLETERPYMGMTVNVLRFDTRMVGGDWTIIRVPMAFDDPTHRAARQSLFVELCRWQNVDADI